MPLIIKSGDTLRQLEREHVVLRGATGLQATQQIFAKVSGAWMPVFSDLTLPRWGYAKYSGPDLSENGYLGPQSFIEENLTTMMDSSGDGKTLTYNIPDGETYAYFAHPKSLGIAVFTDTGNDLQGAWDGASWYDDYSNMDAVGPIEVTFDGGSGPEQWYVYRTDWAGPATATFRIDYPNRS